MRSERIIGQVVGAQAGPTLLLVGGIHGNEPAGVTAARDTIALAERLGSRVRGEIIGLRGNMAALAAGRRQIARDFNRMWKPEMLAAISAAATPRDEEIELAELWREIEAVAARARGRLFAVDLHTTSADGVPFAVVGGTDAHRAFAKELPLPGIVGLEETLDGVLTRCLSQHGWVTVAIEGGQNESAEAARRLHAVCSWALEATGVLPQGSVPGIEAAQAELARARGDLPQLIEVVSRHAVAPEHRFRMEPRIRQHPAHRQGNAHRTGSRSGRSMRPSKVSSSFRFTRQRAATDSSTGARVIRGVRNP